MKRRIVIGAGIVVALLLVALWIVKPWVPDIELTAPGPTGERIVERGVFANYFPAGDAGAGIVLLGGSEGGIGSSMTRMATELQAAGFNVLTPAYFGAPGQRGNLELIPLETFDRALEWLASRPEVDPDRIAVVGHSKGAEAALLVGTRHPELRAVVASAPSSVAWPGIDWEWFVADPSWTLGGDPVTVLPYGSVILPLLTGDIARMYREGLEHLDEHPEAAIDVERIEGNVLLVCGEEDSLWPACAMAREVRARALQEDGPDVRILAYDGAGHRAFGPPLPTGDPELERWGGTPAGNNAARGDGWPKVVEFLRASTIAR